MKDLVKDLASNFFDYLIRSNFSHIPIDELLMDLFGTGHVHIVCVSKQIVIHSLPLKINTSKNEIL